jgi:hypothetical protein
MRIHGHPWLLSWRLSSWSSSWRSWCGQAVRSATQPKSLRSQKRSGPFLEAWHERYIDYIQWRRANCTRVWSNRSLLWDRISGWVLCTQSLQNSSILRGLPVFWLPLSTTCSSGWPHSSRRALRRGFVGRGYRIIEGVRWIRHSGRPSRRPSWYSSK